MLLVCISTSFLLWWNSIFLCRYITLFIHPSIWVVYTFWLLWMMLPWTLVYRFLFLLGIYLGMGLLGHMITLCLTFWGAVRLFSKAAYILFIVLDFSFFFLTFILRGSWSTSNGPPSRMYYINIMKEYASCFYYLVPIVRYPHPSLLFLW